MAKIDELIEGYASDLKGKDVQIVKKEIVQIISDINNLIWEGNIPFSYEDKLDFLRKLKTRLFRIRILKKGQESGVFAQSVNSVADYLKPAVDEIDKEITRLEQAEKDDKK